MEGYIKLYRKFFKNVLWKEPREYSRAEAWLDLIQSARFDSSVAILNGRVIEVRKGDIAASRRYLEKRWGWGSTKVNNFLEMLKSNQMISIKQTAGQTILTLCNYEYYNDDKTTEQTTDKPPTNHRQTTDKPNIKKDNKLKKEKNTLSTSTLADAEDSDIFSFEKMWNLYDKKVGDKSKLQKKWNTISKEDKTKIMDYIPKYKISQPNKKFRKNLETFLKNSSWNDEIIDDNYDQPQSQSTKSSSALPKRSSTI